MNSFSVVVLAAVVAVASAGLLGAPVAYGGVGQLSTQAGALNSASQSLRISQSARPVAVGAYAAPAFAAAPAVYGGAYAAPVAHAVAAPVAHAVAAPVAHAVAAPVAYGGLAAPAVAAAPIGSHIAYGYTPLATSLLG